MNNYQVLHYHYTLSIKKISFLEVSNAGSLVEDGGISTNDKEVLLRSLASLHEFLKKKNNVLAFFSASFLDLLENEFVAELDKIKSHVESGKIELVASCAYHSFSFLCHTELFKKEVALHQAVYKNHFNKEAKLFINTACVFNDQMVDSLGNLSFKGIVAPANSWHLNEIKPADCYQSIGDRPVKIILSNGDSSSKTYVSLTNGFGSGYDDKELQTSDLKELKKHLSSTSKKDVYSASMPLNSPEWSYPIAHYLSSPLQKALFDECRRLIDKFHEKLTDEDWKVIMLVCQPEMLIQLNMNQQNAFQHFINCMNILTAIGLKYK